MHYRMEKRYAYSIVVIRFESGIDILSSNSSQGHCIHLNIDTIGKV